MICRYAYSSTGLEQGLRRVVSAGVATTQAKPHAQQQLARGLEVARSAMGRHRRPHSFGEVQQGNQQPQCRWLGILLCTAVQHQSRAKACDLITHGGQHCRTDGRQFQRATRKVWPALRSGPGPVQQNALCQPSSEDIFFFLKRLAVTRLVFFCVFRILWCE